MDAPESNFESLGERDFEERETVYERVSTFGWRGLTDKDFGVTKLG